MRKKKKAVAAERVAVVAAMMAAQTTVTAFAVEIAGLIVSQRLRDDRYGCDTFKCRTYTISNK